jgi:hypothetical protein
MPEKSNCSRAIVAVLLCAATFACSSTEFVSTWRSPTAQPLRLAGTKVVAVFMSKKEGVRRHAEDAMAREITKHGAQGVASYTVIDERLIRDEKFARSAFERLGFAGSVVMRVVGNQTQVTYTPSYWTAYPYYGHYWGGYWGWGWGSVYAPGYLETEKVVSVETLIYSLRQDQLVWAGVSRTTDPSNLDSFIEELAGAITDQMKSDGLLQ